jgi:hypothetical protein
MALSRLRVTFRSYVLDYLDRTGEIREEPNEELLNAPSNSSGVKKAYTHNKAFTMFVEETPFGQNIYNTFRSKCLDYDFRVVRNVDPDHESYHQSNAEFEEDHVHLLKGRKNPHSMLSLQNVQCILNDIKQYEKAMGYCKDGQTDCLLSDSDQKKILDAYAKYLRQKKIVDQLAAFDKLYTELEGRCITVAKTFTQAFLTTLLEKYIKPYLISKCHDQKKTKWGIEMVKGAITFGLNNSLFNTALDVIIRNGLKAGLQKIGMDPHMVDKIATEIGTIVAFTQNPLSLIELGINGSAAAAGQTAAYQLVRALPKLKVEPEEAPAADAKAVIKSEDQPELRHRHSFNGSL